MIASVMVGRTPRQCRERFKNHVKEGIRKGPWRPEEDAAILQVCACRRGRCSASEGLSAGSGGGVRARIAPSVTIVVARSTLRLRLLAFRV